MNNLKKGLFYSFIIVLFTLQACKPKSVTTTKAPDIIPVNNLLKDVRLNEFTPEWFSGKASVNYKSESKNQSFTVNIRMKKDSIIWASVSPGLGIEVARLVITPDTLLLLNRIEQTYEQGSFSRLNKMLNSNLKFKHLQALLLGNYPEYVENSPINNVAVEGNDYILSAILDPGDQRSQDVMETLWVNPFTNRIKKIRITEAAANRNIEAEYRDFTTEGDKMFPNDATIKVAQKSTHEVKLTWSKVNTNDPLEFPFSIPSNYTKE